MMGSDYVDVYVDDAGEWRWTFVRGNGRTLADSGEGYKRRARCVQQAGYVLGFRDAAFTWADDGKSGRCYLPARG